MFSRWVVSIVILTAAIIGCRAQDVEMWLTKPDRSALLEKRSGLKFAASESKLPVIKVDPAEKFQTIDGFGYTLTGGSAEVINKLPIAKKTALLNELFGSDKDSISISYLRISIGASDLDSEPFTYNDLRPGARDPYLKRFSIVRDRRHLIPILKKILAINPKLKIMASPWSAPVWMKTKQSFIGGSLRPEYYAVYAKYFVKYLMAMRREGIKIEAITPQNEPLHDGNNPSMLMTAVEQLDFIKGYLGPALRKAGLDTKIVIYDHNCDKPEYPISILNDPEARKYIDGSAFHLYGGNISAMSKVREAHPDKNLYFTEQYTSSYGNFGGDLKWHLKNVVIGSIRNWSRTVLEWNLATDEFFRPHTNLGCNTCRGALLVTSRNEIVRNVSYYIIAHASKFVPPGSVRIRSDLFGEVHTAAFQTAQGKTVLVTVNDGKTDAEFEVECQDRRFRTKLGPGEVATYAW